MVFCVDSNRIRNNTHETFLVTSVAENYPILLEPKYLLKNQKQTTPTLFDLKHYLFDRNFKSNASIFFLFGWFERIIADSGTTTLKEWACGM